VQGGVGSSDVSFKQHSSNLGLTLRDTPKGIGVTPKGIGVVFKQHNSYAQVINRLWIKYWQGYTVMHRLSLI